MTPDRQLLEDAAKAAGITGEWSKTIGGWDCLVRPGGGLPWQPLHDDGDAFRLAVKLRLDFYNYGAPVHDEAHVDVVHMDGRSHGYASEELGTDPYAATRRAVVRAAAELGRAGSEGE